MKTTNTSRGLLLRFCDDGVKLPGVLGWRPTGESRARARDNRCSSWGHVAQFSGLGGAAPKGGWSTDRLFGALVCGVQS